MNLCIKNLPIGRCCSLPSTGEKILVQMHDIFFHCSNISCFFPGLRSRTCGHRNSWVYIPVLSDATASRDALLKVSHGPYHTFKNFMARMPAHSPTDGTRGGAVAGSTSMINTPSKTSIHLCEEAMSFPLSFYVLSGLNLPLFH
jgi:hypothetical protein